MIGANSERDGAARRTLSLFLEDRVEGLLADTSIVGVKLSELRAGHKGTHWDRVLFVLVAYRLLAPGTASGFSAARWPICWASMPGWPRSTNYTAVTTGSWGTSRRCSIPCGAMARSVQHLLRRAAL